jgi:HemY protein
MRRIVFLLASAAAVVGLAWWLAAMPGDVTLRLLGLTIETRSGLALLGAVILLLLLLFVLRLGLAVVNIPAAIRRWLARRRREKGDAAVAEALVALAAADVSAARGAARRARDLLGDTAQTLLLDAEANRMAGREGEAAALYKRMAARPDAAFLGLRGLFRQAMAREDWAEAAALARRADATRPGAGWLRDERMALAVRIGDWSEAAKLATTARPRLGFATAAAEASVDPDRALSLAKAAWKDDRGFTPAALAYATRLRQAGREAKALSVLGEAWTESPHPALAELALAPTTDKLARVAAATKLTIGAVQHPETHLLLARLTLDAGLTGEARRHIQAARAGGLHQRRVWLLIADLEAAEHGTTEAGQRAQRDALHAAATAEPDPAWQCDGCGASHVQWYPACPECQSVGLRWGGRKRLALGSS